MTFFKSLLSSTLGALIAIGLFFFIGLIFLMGLVASSSSEDAPVIRDNSVLYLNMAGLVAEQVVEDDLAEMLGDEAAELGVRDLVKAIEAAKEDDKIKGIYLETKYLLASYASLEEIRNALLDFKESDKFIYAYGEYMSESDYYVASVADKIYLNPEGAFEFNGMSANITFLTGMFEKLDIKPEIFRVGEFKSFVEPYTRKNMSDENRLQYTELLNSIYDHYLAKVSESIDIAPDQLEALSDGMKVSFPEEAVEYGLITDIVYEDVVKNEIRDELDLSEKKSIRFVSMKDYIKATREKFYGSKGADDRIAVIVAEGNIVISGDDESVGGEQFAKLIRKARLNDKVKAIVLRINSPGGSLTGSDMIWREVMLAKEEKPVVASMSDVAASGGYYIAMGCDKIIAQPTTITGSIGIFSMFFTLDEFMENKLGITNDQVGTGAYSDFLSITRPMKDYERQVMQKGVEDGYETFITKVAEGRNMSVDAVKEIAGGRVWSGLQAKEIGLVDELGSYEDAIEMAAKLAEVESYKLSFYPKKKTLFENLFGNLESNGASIFSKDPILAKYEKQIKALRNMQGIQALMPGNLEIR